MSEEEHIGELLDQWDTHFRPDADLAARVRAIAGSKGESDAQPRSIAVWFSDTFSRPGLAACFAGVFILVGMGLSQLITGGFRSSGDELTLSYRLSIDPIYRLQAMAGAEPFIDGTLMPVANRPQETAVLLAGLGWLQGQLKLSDLQYEEVTALHSQYEGAFDDLFARLVESHRVFQTLDRKRMKDDVIDYFQVYELLQTQKKLSEESTRLTEELLGRVEEVIEPQQRTRYRELLDSVYPRTASNVKSLTDA